MQKHIRNALGAIVVTLFFTLAMMYVDDARSQDVTHCKNYETGQIIVVEAGMPCPFPTVQL